MVGQSTSEITPRERFASAFRFRDADRIPTAEILINPHITDILLGDRYPLPVDAGYRNGIRHARACAELGLDAIVFWPDKPRRFRSPLPDGRWVDEFGRVWQEDPTPGAFMARYLAGAIHSWEDARRFRALPAIPERLPEAPVKALMEEYRNYPFVVGHAGPFELIYEGMGIEEFCCKLYDDRPLVRYILDQRTDWYIELMRAAVSLGAEYIIVCDDAGFKGSPLLSPRDFSELMAPCYEKIVSSLDVPCIWHSDGYIMDLLPVVMDCGFKGVQALEPAAGIDLAEAKRRFGDRLVLMGNVDCGYVLCQPDLSLVRKEVDRCISDAGGGGGYVLTCSNSLHMGVLPENAIEMHRYAREAGKRMSTAANS